MSIDPKFVELTADVLEYFYKVPTPTVIVEKNKLCTWYILVYIYFFYTKRIGPLPLRKSSPT